MIRSFLKLTLCLMALVAFKNAKAQQIITNGLYDFSQVSDSNSDTLHSEIKFVFAGDNQIVVTGNVKHTVGKPHIFTAAFKYSGELKWKREIQVPSGFAQMNITGFVNLKKLNNGNFVIAGLLRNTRETILHKSLFCIFLNLTETVWDMYR